MVSVERTQNKKVKNTKCLSSPLLAEYNKLTYGSRCFQPFLVNPAASVIADGPRTYLNVPEIAVSGRDMQVGH